MGDREGKAARGSRDAPEFHSSLKCEKTHRRMDPFRVERYFTRPLAWLLVRALLPTRAKPNHVTVAAFVMGCGAAVALSFGHPLPVLIGGALFQLSSIIDCADGMLARTRGESTHFGAFLDLMLDRLTDFLVMTGIVAGYFRATGDGTFAVAGLVGVTVYFLEVSLHYLWLIYRGSRVMGQSADARGLTVFVIFVCALLYRLDILIWVFILAPTAMLAVTVARFFAREGEAPSDP